MEFCPGGRFWRLLLIFMGAATVQLSGEPPGDEPPLPQPPELRAVPDFYVEVAESETRVLVATVHLTVGNLTLGGEDEPALNGAYSIDVPLLSSKNETGSFILPLERPLVDYLTTGGALTGKGESLERPDEPRLITCELRPAAEDFRRGDLHLSIDTGNRVLKFQTTYRVVGDPPSLGLASP